MKIVCEDGNSDNTRMVDAAGADMLPPLQIEKIEITLEARQPARATLHLACISVGVRPENLDFYWRGKRVTKVEFADGEIWIAEQEKIDG